MSIGSWVRKWTQRGRDYVRQRLRESHESQQMRGMRSEGNPSPEKKTLFCHFKKGLHKMEFIFTMGFLKMTNNTSMQRKKLKWCEEILKEHPNNQSLMSLFNEKNVVILLDMKKKILSIKKRSLELCFQKRYFKWTDHFDTSLHLNAFQRII